MNCNNENSNSVMDEEHVSDSDEDMPLSEATTVHMPRYYILDTEFENDSGDISHVSDSTDFSNNTEDNSVDVVNFSQDDVILENDISDIFRSSPEIDFVPFLFIDGSNNSWVFNNINDENRIICNPQHSLEAITLDDMEELENTSENTEYNVYIESQSTLQDPQIHEHEELQSTSETSDNNDNMDQTIAEPIDQSWEPDDCVICLDIMLVHGCRTLPCGHTFHKKCICKWFKVVLNCPACRNTQM